MNYTHEHLEIQKTLKRFIDDEINPHVDEWEEAEIFPAHQVFKRLGERIWLATGGRKMGTILGASFALRLIDELRP